MDFHSYLAARNEYIDRIRRELLGPGSEVSIPDAEHEIISTAPNVRYSIGVLFPKNIKMNADNDDAAPTSSVESEEEELEPLTEDESIPAFDSDAAEAIVPAEGENLDEEISLATQNMPSSFDLLFWPQENCKS